eukprot:757220-Hanusia_phi.AAC.1
MISSPELQARRWPALSRLLSTASSTLLPSKASSGCRGAAQWPRDRQPLREPPESVTAGAPAGRRPIIARVRVTVRSADDQRARLP